MPTERFYRLPKEKAETIRMAAVEEFKRVPPEEASINKIIQSADISRGSFYTYFEDKYDLLKWLIGDFLDNYKQFYVIELQKNNGNLWDVYDRVLDYAIEWVGAQGLVEIVGNMMKGKAFEEQFQSHPAEGCILEETRRKYMKQLYDLTSPECCSLDFDDFTELMGMHMTSLLFALKMYFTREQSADKIHSSYERKMQILRYGADGKKTQYHVG